MGKKGKVQKGLLGSIILACMIASGCTKERPYKEVLKTDIGVKQENKSIIDTNVDYLYVPSSLENTRRSGASYPYWMGEGKRIRFVFSERALRVIEPEPDGRFTNNPTNNNAVLTIPIEHIDYKCSEDAYGDCTHQEVENKDIPWDQKKQFRLKPESIALQQIQFLPVEIGKFFGSCYSEVGSEFVKAELTADAVNLILEKTYQSSPSCVDFSDLEDITDLTFTVRYQHSFAKISKLASADYKPAQYTRADEGNFGFFATKRHKLDVDNNDIIQSESHLFDRWNPNRTVQYSLNEAFMKPENLALKKATYQAFEAVNQALAKAGTKLRLKLNEPVEGMSSGDIRHNMIVMVEDPQAAGIIGYGPHASHPETGEILHARTVMYLGTIKKHLKFSYDELVQEHIQAKALSESESNKMGTTQGAKPKLQLAEHLVVKSAKGNSNAQSRDLAGLMTSSIRPISSIGKAPTDLISNPVQLERLKDATLNPLKNPLVTKSLDEKLDFLSAHCAYPAELFNFTAAVEGEIGELLEEVGLKAWEQLSENEKNKVIDTLLPHVWLPTLVHELGHNLGLRHNFAGSEDVPNFYTEQELLELDVRRPIRYSSIMDYSYKTTNELRHMGKYDIAALRYGYAEQVELEDGSMVSLGDLRQDPSLQMKPYAFCTDEHVGANPNCNRFDEGTNILEIAQHYVRAYEERYKRANFRNNRRNFSLMKDAAQLGAINHTMSGLRLIFERYENIKNTFSLPDAAPEWESIDFLKELKAATILAGNFYLNVLKTPDLLCAVSEAQNPTQIIAVLPIRALSKSAITCFDQENVQLNPQYIIVAEGGKSFQSRKDPSSSNPYVDQIDVRGIWMDKLLASHYLFARELESPLFDKSTENFLHIPELQGAVLETLRQLTTDELSGPVSFRTIFGFNADLNVGYKLFDGEDMDNTHAIPVTLDSRVQNFFSLPNQTSLFQEELIKTVRKSLPSRAHKQISDEVLNLFKISKELPRDGREDQYLSVEIGSARYFALPQSAISAELLMNYSITSILSQLTWEQIQKLISELEKEGPGTPDEDKQESKTLSSGEIEKIAKSMGPEILTRFLNGGFQAQSYYALMIDLLAI